MHSKAGPTIQYVHSAPLVPLARRLPHASAAGKTTTIPPVRHVIGRAILVANEVMLRGSVVEPRKPFIKLRTKTCTKMNKVSQLIRYSTSILEGPRDIPSGMRPRSHSRRTFKLVPSNWITQSPIIPWCRMLSSLVYLGSCPVFLHCQSGLYRSCSPCF